MTEALIIPTSFGGKQIQVIEKDGDIWMPCKDLSVAFGLDRTTCFQHVKRKREFFGPAAQDGDKLSQDGDIWINEIGFYLLLSGIKVPKDSQAHILISQFRKTVPELIQQYRKKEIVPAHEPAQELDEVIAYDLIEARQIAELTGTDPKAMQAAALRKLGYPELADVLAPPVYAHGETGWHTVTELCEKCDDGLLSGHPERLNQYLTNYREDGEWRPFQVREGKIWRLTKRGMAHGKECQFNLGNGHSEPRISWRESILYTSGLKRMIADDQAALTAQSSGSGY